MVVSMPLEELWTLITAMIRSMALWSKPFWLAWPASLDQIQPDIIFGTKMVQRTKGLQSQTHLPHGFLIEQRLFFFRERQNPVSSYHQWPTSIALALLRKNCIFGQMPDVFSPEPVEFSIFTWVYMRKFPWRPGFYPNLVKVENMCLIFGEPAWFHHWPSTIFRAQGGGISFPNFLKTTWPFKRLQLGEIWRAGF